MSVEFKEGCKSLIFDIAGYETSELFKGIDDYDANWLRVHIDYTDGQWEFSGNDGCLLTFEFEEVIERIDKIINGDESGSLETFLEPYLTFAITGIGDMYAVQIRFVYSASETGWKDFYICQGMSYDELVDMNNDFKELYKRFPIRKI